MRFLCHERGKGAVEWTPFDPPPHSASTRDSIFIADVRKSETALEMSATRG
jgi:hypothetical protein